ncbi:MAG: CDP-alcohol phosphatidyltransferase family protein [Nitrospirae bacterium]|nr:CDP-alcohol phosphatidyltransferase family protein [Nitrospirota bacterium]
MKIISLPNVITLIRIIIIPLFVAALIYRRFDYGLYLFLGAAISDGLDGLLARATNQRTEIGSVLDPLADKFLLITAFILFAYYSWIPTWLVIAILSRDAVVVIGWFLLFLQGSGAKTEPLLTGKIAIVSEFALISFIILSINFESFPKTADWMFLVVAALAIISGLQYVLRGLRQLEGL